MCVFVLILGGRRAFFLEVGISRHAANLFTFQTHIFFYSFFLFIVCSRHAHRRHVVNAAIEFLLRDTHLYCMLPIRVV